MHTEEHINNMSNSFSEDDADLLNAGETEENNISHNEEEKENRKEILEKTFNEARIEEIIEKFLKRKDEAVNNNTVEINRLIGEIVDKMIKSDNFSKEECESAIEKLADAYDKGYRHSYSFIAEQMYRSIGGEVTSIDNLQRNIEMFMSLLNRRQLNLKQINGFDKLHDHIKLEALRIENNSSIVNRAKKDIKDLSNKVQEDIKESSSKIIEEAKKDTDNTIKKVENLQSESKDINERMEKIYSEYISILGIFAAVVLVFFGGASIFSGIFAEIKDVSIWKIGFAGSLAGLVIFNVIFMFLYIISKIVNRPISSEDAESKFDKMCYVRRIAKKYPYMFWFNILMLAIFIICA